MRTNKVDVDALFQRPCYDKNSFGLLSSSVFFFKVFPEKLFNMIAYDVKCVYYAWIYTGGYKGTNELNNFLSCKSVNI